MAACLCRAALLAGHAAVRRGASGGRHGSQLRLGLGCIEAHTDQRGFCRQGLLLQEGCARFFLTPVLCIPLLHLLAQLLQCCVTSANLPPGLACTGRGSWCSRGLWPSMSAASCSRAAQVGCCWVLHLVQRRLVQLQCAWQRL